MTIYVICCNDNLIYAVAGDEKRAKYIMKELKENQQKSFNLRDDCENYYWHIHKVDGE